MLQLGLVAVLALLWMLTLTNVGGTDFLRVTAFKYGFTVIRTQDVLIGLAILGVAITTRGPLALTAIALFCVWLLTLFGVPQLFGVVAAVCLGASFVAFLLIKPVRGLMGGVH